MPDAVRDGNEAIVVTRLLSAMMAADDALPSWKAKWEKLSPSHLIFDMVLSFGPERAGNALEGWYRVEPNPDTRRVVLGKALSWSSSPEWAARRTAVLTLAAKDWDEEIARGAQELLDAAGP